MRLVLRSWYILNLGLGSRLIVTFFLRLLPLVLALLGYGTFYPTWDWFCLTDFVRGLILNLEVRLRHLGQISSNLWQWYKFGLLCCLLIFWIFISFGRVSLVVIQSDLAAMTDRLTNLILAFQQPLPSISADSWSWLNLIFACRFTPPGSPVFIGWEYSIDS
jgi:hypothetical protein